VKSLVKDIYSERAETCNWWCWIHNGHKSARVTQERLWMILCRGQVSPSLSIESVIVAKLSSQISSIYARVRSLTATNVQPSLQTVRYFPQLPPLASPPSFFPIPVFVPVLSMDNNR
jgi:hypothetical protein